MYQQKCPQLFDVDHEDILDGPYADDMCLVISSRGPDSKLAEWDSGKSGPLVAHLKRLLGANQAPARGLRACDDHQQGRAIDSSFISAGGKRSGQK